MRWCLLGLFLEKARACCHELWSAEGFDHLRTDTGASIASRRRLVPTVLGDSCCCGTPGLESCLGDMCGSVNGSSSCTEVGSLHLTHQSRTSLLILYSNLNGSLGPIAVETV